MDQNATRFARFRDTGDISALGRVFDDLAPRLLSLALHFCGNPTDAEDVLQETFLVAMQRAESYDPSRPLLPWFAGLLHNVARNHRRRAVRRRAGELPGLSELPSAREIDPRDQAEREELVALLRTRVDEFPAEQRQVVLLRLLHGLSPAEIAEVIDEPPGTVRMRLMRALRRLRISLPAGLSLALFGLTARRGMAAVRSAVLRDAASCAASCAATDAAAVSSGTTTVATTMFGGSLVMMKFLGAVGIALVCALLWMLSGIGQSSTPVATLDSPSTMPGHELRAEEGGTQRKDVDAGELKRVQESVPSGALVVGLRSLTQEQRQFAGPGARRDDRFVIGDPIPGAVIQLWKSEVQVAPFDGSVREVATDARGEARFGNLEPGIWQVLHPADPKATAHRVVIEAMGEARCNLMRDAEGVVRGRVVDIDGQPVAGAEIWVSRIENALGRDNLSEPIDVRMRCAATSDSQGSFALSYGGDEQSLAASHPSFVASRKQLVRGYGRTGLTLTLGPHPSTIAGRVIEPEGTPAKNVLIQVRPAGQDWRRARDGTRLLGRMSKFGRTDADGRFEFGGLPAGTHRLGIRAIGREALVHNAAVEESGRVDVELRLKTGGIRITGFVRTSDGEPFPARMRAKPRKDSRGHYSDHSTRADGSYYLSYAPSRRFAIVASGRDGPYAFREFEDAKPGLIRCDLVVENYATLRGKLVDERGDALPRWHVRAGRSGSVTTAADGTFRVVARRGETHTLAAARPNDAWHPVAELTDVQFGVPIEFRIPDSARPRGIVRGRILDARGIAIDGAEVELGPNGAYAPIQTVRADPKGGFRFSSVAQGKYRILVAAHGLDAREVGRLDVADGGVHDLGPLTISKPARLDIAFTHADGRPWTGDHPRVGVFDAAAKRVSTHIDARVGATVLTLIVPTNRPASYKVELSGVDLVAGTQQVELAPGTRARLQFAVTIAHSREITFNYDGKDPFKDKRAMHVEVRDAAGALVCERNLVAEHRHLHVYNYWCLRHTFANGRYTVFGRASNGTTYRGTFTVGANLDEPTRIEVPVGG